MKTTKRRRSRPGPKRAWATYPKPGTSLARSVRFPCIWGSRADARAGRDPDEVVIQIEYTIVKSAR